VLTAACLFRLWQGEKQVRLHIEHFLHAIEQKAWAKAGAFMDEQYRDQWGQDRTLVLARLREVLPYMRNLQIRSEELAIVVRGNDGTWRGRITLEAEPDEISALIKERVNALDESPFELQWRKVSGSPWDWKLIRVTNAELELPDDG
jgi:hypothetical protein